MTMVKNDRFTVAVAVSIAMTTVVLSMVLNSWAFTAKTPGYFGIVVGVLLPVWTLALVYMGHSLYPSQRTLGIAAYSLAGFALLVSLPHLASGYATITPNWWEGWALAAVTDLTQVVSKLLIVHLASTKVATKQATAKPTAKRSAKPRVIGTAKAA